MAHCAWYYYAGRGVYYWTESYTLSATQFAEKVSEAIGKMITAADISAVKRQSDIESVKKSAQTLIYVS